jgi:hypothetical protein
MPKREIRPRAPLPCWTSKRTLAQRSGGDPQPARRSDRPGHRVSTDPLPLTASRRGLGGWTDSDLYPLHGIEIANDTPRVWDGEAMKPWPWKCHVFQVRAL